VTGLAFIQLADEGKPAPRLKPDDANPPRIPLRLACWPSWKRKAR
jgi:phospholipid/cholesterol/gamma-HCH transport system substrate-binding protein